MEKIWLKSYPKGVKTHVDVDHLGTIFDVFNRSVEKFPDHLAFTNIRTSLTYRQTKVYIDQFSSFLQNELRVKKGDRIAIMMPNVLQYPVAVFGALQAGMVVVNVNPLYTATELEHQLKDSGAETLLILENFAHTYAEIAANVGVKQVIVAKIGDLLHSFWGPLFNFSVKYIGHGVPSYQFSTKRINFAEAMRLGAKEPFKPVAVSNQDLAFLQYTGGTTGVAKGAMLTHRNICANIAQAGEWVTPLLKPGVECIVTALPLYHIFSFTVNLMILASLGAHNILITNPRSIKTFIGQLKNKKYGITVFTGVNTLYNGLEHHAEFAKIDFSSWKLCLGGGTAIQKNVALKWQEITGLPILEAYGLTEASPGVIVCPITQKSYSGYAGLPIPDTDISIRDEKGKELGTGKPGELWIKGPQVMKGYWHNPEETKKVLNKGGWLDTGDIAEINKDGFVKLVDRRKDMIIVSGFNVYPNEVEDVISANPGVAECCAISVPSEKTGEAIKVFVVKKDPNLTEQDLIAYARKSLTGYKVPKIFEFRDELPKSNVGKILRRVLKEEEDAKRAKASKE